MPVITEMQPRMQPQTSQKEVSIPPIKCRLFFINAEPAVYVVRGRDSSPVDPLPGDESW